MGTRRLAQGRGRGRGRLRVRGRPTVKSRGVRAGLRVTPGLKGGVRARVRVGVKVRVRVRVRVSTSRAQLARSGVVRFSFVARVVARRAAGRGGCALRTERALRAFGAVLLLKRSVRASDALYACCHARVRRNLGKG